MAQPAMEMAVAAEGARQGPPKPAFEKVLNTTELLEMILLHLPCIDLFGVQRVCQTIRDTIQESTKIKQAMFLEAEPERSSETSSDGANRKYNPLLESMIFVPAKGLRDADPNDGFRWRGISINNESRPLTEGPLYEFSETSRAHADVRRFCISPEGSWRKMIIAQPTPAHFGTKLLSHQMRDEVMDTFQFTTYLGHHDVDWDCKSDLGSIFDELVRLSGLGPSSRMTLRTY